MLCNILTFNIRLYFAPYTISQKSLKNPQLFLNKAVIKKKTFLKDIWVINLFCSGTFWLLGSRPAECLFFHRKYSAESLWRMSWSASKHLARLAGMRDILLWKLGWAPQTVQNTPLSFSGRYPFLYHWASVSVRKQISAYFIKSRCAFH